MVPHWVPKNRRAFVQNLYTRSNSRKPTRGGLGNGLKRLRILGSGRGTRYVQRKKINRINEIGFRYGRSVLHPCYIRSHDLARLLACSAYE
jgi:hypothetical protein